MKIYDLKPWMHGPFELIRHADGHLIAKGDTDRRIALIGFDNAIEVSIDVFIRLHPKLRRGVEFPKTAVETATRNYHTKIEFLDNYVQTQQIPLSIPVSEIVWYHQLRNELYHSGNGMVPERRVIVGARSASLDVFYALFNVDVTGLLADGSPAPKNKPQQTIIQSQNPAMEFLRLFIELEKEIRKFAPAQGSRPMPPFQMWQALLKVRTDLEDLEPLFPGLLRTRNSIVHGTFNSADEEKLHSRMESLLDIIDRLPGKHKASN